MSEPPITPDEDPGPEVSGWDDSPVAGDRVDVHMGPIVAGDPAGARVEVTGDGIHAYDATGQETARIQGESGEFVGGSFRTSDTLPGQVTLSDTGYISPETHDEGPGIRVTPASMAGLVAAPSLGPSANGMVISGGESTAGTAAFTIYAPTAVENRFLSKNGSQATAGVNGSFSYLTSRDANGNEGVVEARPTVSIVRSRYADGSGAQIYASGDSAELATADAAWTTKAKISVDGREAYLWTTGVDGISRILSVDSDGVWVKTNKGGTWKHYNLEQTAQDSGWQPFNALPGITTSGDLAWRNKNGVIYFRGYVTGSWTTGYQFLTGQLPPEMRPTAVQACMAPSSQDSSMMLRVHPTGRIDLNKPIAGSATAYLSGISYPLD